MGLFFNNTLTIGGRIILWCIGRALAGEGEPAMPHSDYSTYEEMAWALMSEPNREELMPTVILSHLNRAIELAPDRVRTDSYSLRALCWNLAGNKEMAIRDWTTVVEREPGNPKYVEDVTILAAEWGERKESSKAAEYAGRALSLDPDYAVARVVRAAAYRDMGMLDEAKEELRIGIELDPHMTNVINLPDFFEKGSEKGSPVRGSGQTEKGSKGVKKGSVP